MFVERCDVSKKDGSNKWLNVNKLRGDWPKDEKKIHTEVRRAKFNKVIELKN